MIVKIDLSVLNKEEAFAQLDYLVNIIVTGKHKFYFESFEEAELINSNWFDSLGDRVQFSTYELFTKAAVESSRISSQEIKERVVLEITNSEDVGSLLAEANAILEEVLYILIEDFESDGGFLIRLTEIYKKASKSLVFAHKKRWVQLQHCGGKTSLIRMLERYPEPSSKDFKKRAFVIVDSDRKHPNDTPADTVKISDICKSKNIPIHVLEKREIENYIPDNVFRKLVPRDLEDRLNAYVSMTPVQKDYYDLEKGFGNTRPDAADPLFADLNLDKRFDPLRYGFQTKEFDAKGELFKYIKDDDFNQESIGERCKHQSDPKELRNIIVKISNYL